jgi:hypothetical protein
VAETFICKRFYNSKRNSVIYIVNRVTRLGELSPIGQWLTVGSFFVNYRSSPDVGLFFDMEKITCKLGLKKEWAVFWQFFTNSSGHTDCEWDIFEVKTRLFFHLIHWSICINLTCTGTWSYDHKLCRYVCTVEPIFRLRVTSPASYKNIPPRVVYICRL